ncbi:MAG: ABC transporter permease [SAR202 cluster bacterium]|jgi:ABC-2 type transport system permease protein|nr:ABC transporter permease [SAR202 cluster bacterium]
MGLIVRQAMLIAAKDTKIFFKDRFAVGFAFLFPFLFVIGFSLALGDVEPDDEQLILTLTTNELPGLSQQMIQSIEESSGGLISSMEYNAAKAAVEDGSLSGFVAFPRDFTDDVFTGRPTSLEVVVQDATPQTQAALEGLARAIASRTAEIRTAVRAIGQLSEASGDLVDLDLRPLIQPSEVLLYFEAELVGEVKAVKATNLTLPGYLTMFVFFAAALSAEAIARERQTHTLERLMSNGARRESIILGKFLGTSYRGLMQLAALWIVGLLAFRIDLGVAPAAVILISVLMALASAGFGIMLASFVSEVRAAASLGVLASLTMAPLGGSWWPLFITPEWMQTLAKITPHGWANTGFNKLMIFGAEFSDVTNEMIALAVFGVAFVIIALWRFRLSAK